MTEKYTTVMNMKNNAIMCRVMELFCAFVAFFMTPYTLGFKQSLLRNFSRSKQNM